LGASPLKTLPRISADPEASIVGVEKGQKARAGRAVQSSPALQYRKWRLLIFFMAHYHHNQTLNFIVDQSHYSPENSEIEIITGKK
jgi:hypothetical protein